jgi:hypothetical protein
MGQSNLRLLLENWYQRIRASHKGHYKDAALLEKRQKILGGVVVGLTALIGTSLFFSLTSPNQNKFVTLLAGLLSALTTVLAALQTYLNYPAKQTTHIIAATQLSSIKKKIEEKLAIEEDPEELKLFIREIRTEWDAITHGAPLMSEKTFDSFAKADKKYFELASVSKAAGTQDD